MIFTGRGLCWSIDQGFGLLRVFVVLELLCTIAVVTTAFVIIACDKTGSRAAQDTVTDPQNAQERLLYEAGT